MKTTDPIHYPGHDPSEERSPIFRTMRFPWLYSGIIFAGSLDVLLTGILLAMGAREANPLADAILQTYGFAAMVLFKYLIVGLVIIACEFVADHDQRKARNLAFTLIAIHAAPVVWSTSLLIFAL